LARRAQFLRPKIGCTPLGIGAFPGDGTSALVEAEQRERRNQHCTRKQEWRRAHEKWLHP